MVHPQSDSPKSTIAMLLVAFSFTAVLIFSYQFLPEKSLQVSPGRYLITHYADSTPNTGFKWLSEDKHKHRCTFGEGSQYCGMDIQFGDGLVEGLDLSEFDNIELDIKYSGEASVVRVYIRNFSAEFSDVEDPVRTAKYISTFVPAMELTEIQSISLNEFSVPEWWRLFSNIPRDLAYPDFDNVTHVGVDVPTPGVHGDHDIEVISIRFTGLYLTKDTWYLVILSLWAVVLLVLAIRRDVYMRETAEENLQHLAVERVRTKRLHRVSEKYKELAILDSLTGVFNRRGIYQFYENTFESPDQPNVSGSLIMLDIDHFKEVNDEHGHDIGDKVINSIGNILLNSVREHDSVGRWGGEEFIVICVSTDADGAALLAEKIRSTVEQHKFSEYPYLNITVSLGISQINRMKKFEENVKAADLALYQAKQTGRNRWIEAEID